LEKSALARPFQGWGASKSGKCLIAQKWRVGAIKILVSYVGVRPAGIAIHSLLTSTAWLVIPFVLEARPCCAVLRAASRESNALRDITTSSLQHGDWLSAQLYWVAKQLAMLDDRN
jgi:hypothetical protein